MLGGKNKAMDCVYHAWVYHVEWLGVEPSKLAYRSFRSLYKLGRNTGWDEDYQVPEDGYERGNNPVCTHHLSHAVLRMVAVAAASVVEDFMDSGARRTQLVTGRKAL